MGAGGQSSQDFLKCSTLLGFPLQSLHLNSGFPSREISSVLHFHLCGAVGVFRFKDPWSRWCDRIRQFYLYTLYDVGADVTLM